MKNRNGFTFVEMLAVVAIVGLLLGISTFAISKVLDNSRKEIYLASVKTQLEGVKLLIESEEYDVYDENTTYYFDYHLLKQTDDIRSPYGDWVDAYVVVTYNGEKLKYYWTGIDTAGWRIDLRKQVEKMTKKDIYNKAGNILAGNSLEGKDNIVVSKVNDKGKEVQEDEELSNHLTAEEADLCYEYEMLDDNTCRITNYKESCGSDVNMPSSINGSVVTKIGRGSFRGKNITSVTLYDGVEVIELGAFQDNAINKLKLSKSIKKIEDYAFYKNQIPEVSFPEGLTTIGSWGFANNKIKKVLFPESLKTIGPYAFYGNLLTEITFNSNPTLGGAAFSNNKMPSSEGILYLYDATTKQFDYSTIIGYCTDVKDLVIPPEVNGIQPKRIKSNAFANSGLTSVRMPDSIEVIESDAFAFNSIATVNLSTSLKTIGNGAFRSNDITHIDIPPTVTSIGNYAFVTNRLTGDNSIIYARNSSGIDYTTIVSYGGGRTDGNIHLQSDSGGLCAFVLSLKRRRGHRNDENGGLFVREGKGAGAKEQGKKRFSRERDSQRPVGPVSVRKARGRRETLLCGADPDRAYDPSCRRHSGRRRVRGRRRQHAPAGRRTCERGDRRRGPKYAAGRLYCSGIGRWH